MSYRSNKNTSLVEARTQAQWFDQVRQDHRQERAQDYCELIHQLTEVKGEARLADISQRFGVSNPYASKVIGHLQQDGLIHSRPYRSIFLTEKGRKLAKDCHKRHQLVVAFLQKLGVSQTTAMLDAEGIEHHLSQQTLQKMSEFVSNN